MRQHIEGYLALAQSVIVWAIRDWQRYGIGGLYAPYLEALRASQCACDETPVSCEGCSCDRELIAFWNSEWAAWLCEEAGLSVGELRRLLYIPESEYVLSD